METTARKNRGKEYPPEKRRQMRQMRQMRRIARECKRVGLCPLRADLVTSGGRNDV